MNIDVPSIEVIRAGLICLKHAQIQRLSVLSKVPFTTLWKIRDGTTVNPGIATVGLFARHMHSVKTGVDVTVATNALPLGDDAHA